MNPQALMQFMSAINTFKSNHPKFASFMERYMKSGLPEGSVIEITVTEPGAEPVTTHMKVLQSALELIQSLKDFRGESHARQCRKLNYRFSYFFFRDIR